MEQSREFYFYQLLNACIERGRTKEISGTGKLRKEVFIICPAPRKSFSGTTPDPEQKEVVVYPYFPPSCPLY